MLEPFITVADLTEYIGADAYTPSGEFAVAAACQSVRDHLDNDVNAESVADLALDGTGTDQMVLPRPPIREIVSVTECGDLLTETDDYFLRGSILYRVGARWPSGRATVVVSYDRGWDFDVNPSYPGSAVVIPETIRLVALSVAKRILASGALPVGGLSGETIGNYQYTKAENAAAVFELDEGEVERLGRYRKPGLA